MHQRSDRDEYVVVKKESIIKRMHRHFDIVGADDEFGTYDFGSILHPPYHVIYKFILHFNNLPKAIPLLLSDTLFWKKINKPLCLEYA